MTFEKLINLAKVGPWQKFWAQPCIFLAQKLYNWHKPIPATPISNPIAIVCISNTHNKHTQIKIPDGDILIHAGDLTQSGSLKEQANELQSSLTWLRALPHATKIVIAGTNERLLDSGWDHSFPTAASERARLDWGDIIYLENEEVAICCPNGRQIRLYGSPHSRRHGNWAFQYPRCQDIWPSLVPDGIDVLVTHGPPLAHLDLSRLGCVHLLQTLWRVKPRLHVFGNLHGSAGNEWLVFNGLQDAYERTVAAGGGVRNLLLTAWEFARTCLQSAVEAKCLLVNASIFGELQNNERGQPIKVFI